jgi:hypothetical protein
MRIFAYDRFKPGVTLETIEPYLSEEVANVWRLWKAGIVRENYARADEPGVAVVFELDSVDRLAWATPPDGQRVRENRATARLLNTATIPRHHARLRTTQ